MLGFWQSLLVDNDMMICTCLSLRPNALSMEVIDPDGFSYLLSSNAVLILTLFRCMTRCSPLDMSSQWAVVPMVVATTTTPTLLSEGATALYLWIYTCQVFFIVPVDTYVSHVPHCICRYICPGILHCSCRYICARYPSLYL